VAIVAFPVWPECGGENLLVDDATFSRAILDVAGRFSAEASVGGVAAYRVEAVSEAVVQALPVNSYE